MKSWMGYLLCVFGMHETMGEVTAAPQPGGDVKVRKFCARDGCTYEKHFIIDDDGKLRPAE